MSATTSSTKLWHRLEKLSYGRYRIYIERGALEHVDQIRLKSDRQRERFAQACDAKDPGCFAEVLALLEREANLIGAKYDADTDDGCRLVFTTLDKFLCEDVDWVWENYIPAGAVAILEGDPGVGKTLLLCDLASRVSRGFLAPDRSPAFDAPGHDPAPFPESVWWFSGHDRVEQTLAPRLLAAGANPSMIRVVEGVEDQKTNKCRQVAFPQDFHSLWKSQAAAPRLVIVDPLSAFCGGSLHPAIAHRALAELAKFAAATGAAVLVVRPLNRRLGASASERGSAGPTLLSEARSALLLANHPSDPARKILAPIKSNLCALAPSLDLQIVNTASSDHQASLLRQQGEAHKNQHPTSSEHERWESPSNSPFISWLGRSDLTADDLLRTRPSALPPHSSLDQKAVESWLSEKLSTGPKPAKEITSQAELDDIPPILLRRAQISLGVSRSGRNGSSTWQLKNPPPLAGEGGELASRVGATPQRSSPIESSSNESEGDLVPPHSNFNNLTNSSDTGSTQALPELDPDLADLMERIWPSGQSQDGDLSPLALDPPCEVEICDDILE